MADLFEFLPDNVSRETFAAFIESRKKNRKPLTAFAAKLICRKLAKFAMDGHNPNELLETAIERGWQSVFAPDAARPTGNGKPAIAWWTNEPATIAKGKELGLEPRIGETIADFRGRINAEISKKDAA